MSRVTRDYVEGGRPHVLQDKVIPDYVTIYRIHGPFLFGATDKLTNLTVHVGEMAPIVVLRLRNMTAIDASGLHALRTLSDRLRKSGRTLILCGARAQPAKFLEQAEFVRHVGPKNIVPHVEEALARAQEVQASFAGMADDAASHLSTALL